MNNLPHIKVLILNYNGEKILNRCVQSVLDTDYENLHTFVNMWGEQFDLIRNYID